MKRRKEKSDWGNMEIIWSDRLVQHSIMAEGRDRE